MSRETRRDYAPAEYSSIDYSMILENPLWNTPDGIITSPRTILRQEPSEESGQIDEAFTGTPVAIEKEESSWSYINTYYGYKGWIPNSALQKSPSTFRQKEGRPGIITLPFSDIQGEPRYQASRLRSLPAGSLIQILPEKQEQWCLVNSPDGTEGWIRAESFIPLEKRPPLPETILRQNIVKTAFSYLNTPYRWGGKTAAGIDCSGLCSLAYLLNGVLIYRDAIFKKGLLQECTREELAPADLIYYPGHIVMYLGHNKVLHASGTTGRVSVNSLNPDDPDYLPQLSVRTCCATLFQS